MMTMKFKMQFVAFFCFAAFALTNGKLVDEVTTTLSSASENATTADPSTNCGGIVGFLHACSESTTAKLLSKRQDDDWDSESDNTDTSGEATEEKRDASDKDDDDDDDSKEKRDVNDSDDDDDSKEKRDTSDESDKRKVKRNMPPLGATSPHDGPKSNQSGKPKRELPPLGAESPVEALEDNKPKTEGPKPIAATEKTPQQQTLLGKREKRDYDDDGNESDDSDDDNEAIRKRREEINGEDGFPDILIRKRAVESEPPNSGGFHYLSAKEIMKRTPVLFGSH